METKCLHRQVYEPVLTKITDLLSISRHDEDFSHSLLLASSFHKLDRHMASLYNAQLEEREKAEKLSLNATENNTAAN